MVFGNNLLSALMLRFSNWFDYNEIKVTVNKSNYVQMMDLISKID